MVLLNAVHSSGRHGSIETLANLAKAPRKGLIKTTLFLLSKVLGQQLGIIYSGKLKVLCGELVVFVVQNWWESSHDKLLE